jgi:hypothetical protein
MFSRLTWSMVKCAGRLVGAPWQKFNSLPGRRRQLLCWWNDLRVPRRAAALRRHVEHQPEWVGIRCPARILAWVGHFATHFAAVEVVVFPSRFLKTLKPGTSASSAFTYVLVYSPDESETNGRFV